MNYPLPERLQSSVRIAWHMSSWCNYSCGYCPVLIYHKRSKSGPLQDHAFDHYPVSQWLDAFRSFPQKNVHLKITGGEPFLDRENFRDMLGGLSTLEHFTMRIDSNGSWDPAYFRELDKSRIFLNIAYHANEVDFDTFFRRISLIRDAGFDVEMLNFVLAPENLDAFERNLERVERAGFFVNLSPMNPTGTYLSRTERSSREMALIERYNLPVDIAYKVGSPDTRGRYCYHPAISYYLLFDGRIQVFCTGAFQNLFTDGIPALPREAVPCPFDKCIGCTEMYRSLVDEPLVTTPLSLYPVDEYAREVTAYRKRRRWRQFLPQWKRQRVEPARPKPPEIHIAADGIKPALPAAAIFGSLDTNGSLEARSRDRLALSGWAASQAGAPVKEIRLLLGDRELGIVRDFYFRPDVAQAYQRTELSQCGWRTMVYLPALREGAYRLVAKAIAPDGQAAELAAIELRIID
jgi:MoaA/NifB/PqqE/SkfB family radical SAM enzyme